MYGARAAGNFLFCGDVMMLGPLTKVHDLHETYDFPLCNKYIEAAKKGTKVENHADHADHASLGRSKLGPISVPHSGLLQGRAREVPRIRRPNVSPSHAACL